MEDTRDLVLLVVVVVADGARYLHNLIINYFVGLAVLGKFSNYVMLVAIASNFFIQI